LYDFDFAKFEENYVDLSYIFIVKVKCGYFTGVVGFWVLIGAY